MPERLLKLETQASLALQRVGILPRDEMGGHYLGSLSPVERRIAGVASLAAAQQTENLIYPGKVSAEQLNILESLFQKRILTRENVDAAAATLLPEYAYGIDLSHWQGLLNQEWWQKRSDEGIGFAFVKALGGKVDPLLQDPNLQINLEGALNSGMAAGAYIFVNPNHPITEQVDATIDYVGSLLPDLKLGMVLDLEFGGVQTGSRINTNMESAVTHMGTKNFSAIWVYTNAGFSNRYYPSLSLNGVEGEYLEWPASWTTATRPTLANMWKKEGVEVDWEAWQYTNSLIYDRVRVDGNRMKYPVYQRLVLGGGQPQTITLLLEQSLAQDAVNRIEELQNRPVADIEPLPQLRDRIQEELE